MQNDPTPSARHRAIFSGMLGSSLKRVFVPESTDRFDELLRALDARDRENA